MKGEKLKSHFKGPLGKTIGFFAAWLIGLPVALLAATLILRSVKVPSEVLIFFYVWGAFIAILFWVRFEREPLSKIGLGRGAGSGLFIGLTAGAGTIALIVLILRFAGVLHISKGTWTVTLLAPALLATLVQSATEEVAFRGYLLHMLGKYKGTAFAAIVTSVIFALIHIPMAGFNALGVFNLALWALVLCLVLFRWRNLWIAIGVHIGWNWAEWYGFGFRVYDTSAKAAIFKSMAKGHTLVTGGSFGLEASIFTTLVLIIMLVLLIRSKSYSPRRVIGS